MITAMAKVNLPPLLHYGYKISCRGHAGPNQMAVLTAIAKKCNELLPPALNMVNQGREYTYTAPNWDWEHEG